MEDRRAGFWLSWRIFLRAEGALVREATGGHDVDGAGPVAAVGREAWWTGEHYEDGWGRRKPATVAGARRLGRNRGVIPTRARLSPVGRQLSTGMDRFQAELVW